jgi:hypothetical protein
MVVRGGGREMHSKANQSSISGSIQRKEDIEQEKEVEAPSPISQVITKSPACPEEYLWQRKEEREGHIYIYNI